MANFINADTGEIVEDGLWGLPKYREICWCLSTLIFTTMTRPRYSFSSCSMIGVTMRQGAHQGAQKSMSTGAFEATIRAAICCDESTGAFDESAGAACASRTHPATARPTDAPHRTTFIVGISLNPPSNPRKLVLCLTDVSTPSTALSPRGFVTHSLHTPGMRLVRASPRDEIFRRSCQAVCETLH